MAEREKDAHRCLICQRPVDREALYLRGSWICSACEERLLRTTPEAPSYMLFKERLGSHWQRSLLAKHPM